MQASADVAETVDLPFVDDESQCESLGGRIVFGARLAHAGIGIAVAAIISPDLFSVVIDAVGIVDVATGEEAQHGGRGRLDHRAELTVAEDVIADEIDLPHRGLLAFGDGEDEIDAVAAAVDDLRNNADLVAADAPVGFHDAVDVALDRRALQRAARLGLHGGREIRVLDLLVAFEGDAVEHLGLGDMHDQPLAARSIVTLSNRSVATSAFSAASRAASSYRPSDEA